MKPTLQLRQLLLQNRRELALRHAVPKVYEALRRYRRLGALLNILAILHEGPQVPLDLRCELGDGLLARRLHAHHRAELGR